MLQGAEEEGWEQPLDSARPMVEQQENAVPVPRFAYLRGIVELAEAPTEQPNLRKTRIAGALGIVIASGGHLTMEQAQLEGFRSAGDVIKDRLHLSTNEWTFLRRELARLNLLTFEKVADTPRARCGSIALSPENEQAALELFRSDNFVERRRRKATEQDSPRPRRTKPSVEAPRNVEADKISRGEARAPRRNIAVEKAKNLNLFFRVASGRRFSKNVSVGSFGKLPAQIRLLVAIGQANAPSFSFLNDDLPRKQAYVLKFMNKGVDSKDQLGADEISALINDYETAELINIRDVGPELSDAGLDVVEQKLKGAKFGKVDA